MPDIRQRQKNADPRGDVASIGAKIAINLTGIIAVITIVDRLVATLIA